MEHARLNFMYRHGLAYQLQALDCVLPAPVDVPTAVASNSGQYTYTSKDFRMLAEKVDRLEEQLKESQRQTAELMENLVGGLHNRFQSVFEVPHTSISTPAQNSGVKRKRKTEEATPVVEKRPVDPNSRNYYGD
ncbi:MAG: hypothetical protein Q9221_006715 [Calogaya cf. arnoldii]